MNASELFGAGIFIVFLRVERKDYREGQYKPLQKLCLKQESLH